MEVRNMSCRYGNMAEERCGMMQENEFSSREAPDSSGPTSANGCWPSGIACSAWTALKPDGWRTSPICMGHRDFRFLKHDIVEPFELRVDEIYNLACPASPVHYQADPIHTLKTSVYGSVNLLDLAVRHKAKILQASTSEVYGDPEQHPQQETYWGNVNPNGIRACYDEGKRCAETLFFDYRRHYGVEIKIARIFNTYGPRMDQDDGRVISNFIVQALQHEPITVYGDGTTDPQLLFRQRHDRRPGRPDGQPSRPHRADQSRQSARGDGASSGPADSPAHGLQVPNLFQAASSG